MRNGRRDLNKQADGMSKSGEITEDDHRKLLEKIQEELKRFEKKVDEVFSKKEAEILEV